jgi:hypothetical protein
MERMLFIFSNEKSKRQINYKGICLLPDLQEEVQYRQKITSSSYDDSYEVFFYACALQFYDVYVFFRKAYLVTFK